jgi:hypothetical protein
MKHVTLVAWKLTVLVVAMLAAIGAWEVYKGTVLKAQSSGYTPGTGVPEPEVKDHFVCYQAHALPGAQKFVAIAKIENQFEYSTVSVKDYPRLLCVPTAKELISLQPRGGHGHDDDDDDYDHGKKDEKGKKKK